MTYATLCTGLGGFDAGFDSVGMKCVYQCEQDRDCLRVLRRHWPDVPKSEDVNDDRTIADLVRLRPDIIAFGSPCQDLSVAGRRGGLAAERSGLFFRCMECCFACEAPWVVWENVPGVFSSQRGEDFASVLEAFTGHRPQVPKSGWRNTGVCVGPLYSVAWAVLDAQWFGVPQSRDRVFLVGSLGDRAGPYEVLSLADSMPWHSPPRREAGASAARCLATGTNPSRFDGDSENFVVSALDTKPYADHESKESRLVVTHALTANGFDASEDGTGRGTPIIPIDMRQASRGEKMTNNRPGGSSGGAPGTGIGQPGDPCPTLGMTHTPAIAFALTRQQEHIGEAWRATYLSGQLGVRRLTPLECDRLQGCCDNWTKHGDDGKQISDSARYRMLGNAVCRNVAEWIGRQLMQAATPEPERLSMSTVSDPVSPVTETRRSLPSIRDMPEEVWGLWDTEFSVWTTSLGEQQRVMFTSFTDAMWGVEYHMEHYGRDVVAVRILPRKGV
jgi:DNA (cytosine-5)-methyltransferase 1